MPLMRARLGLAMLLIGLTITVSAGTLTVDVHASYVDDGSTNGYIGSSAYYSWDRAWWEQETYFSFGVTQVINSSSYWSGTVVSDSWNNYLRSGYVEQGQCYTTNLSVQVFTPDSSYPIYAGNDSDAALRACVLFSLRMEIGRRGYQRLTADGKIFVRYYDLPVRYRRHTRLAVRRLDWRCQLERSPHHRDSNRRQKRLGQFLEDSAPSSRRRRL
jgi:hypothetical protein